MTLQIIRVHVNTREPSPYESFHRLCYRQKHCDVIDHAVNQLTMQYMQGAPCLLAVLMNPEYRLPLSATVCRNRSFVTVGLKGGVMLSHELIN